MVEKFEIAKPRIEVVNSIYSIANAAARQLLLPLLAYDFDFYRRTHRGGQVETVKRYLISGRKGSSGTFLTGFISRIRKELPQIEIVSNASRIKPDKRLPEVKGITFREDQIRALHRVRLRSRGVLVYPTGSGKTIIALGIMSLYSSRRVLFLCHTKDLLNQTSEELSKAGMNHYLLGDNKKINPKDLRNKTSFILVAIINSLAKLKKHTPDLFDVTIFDVTIVDECHNASNPETKYGEIMEEITSPIRIGLTATLPSSRYRKLAVEGYFGPVIAELTEDEGRDIGIIAKPIVKILPVPLETKLKNIRGYRGIHRKALVENDTRNRMIVSLAITSLSRNEAVLILVQNIEHGNILKAILAENNINCPFVQGVENSLFRSSIKNSLVDGSSQIAIATRVWNEGVNIPRLNHIIFASGGKDEKTVRQAMGRGFRVTSSKTLITLTDFLDPYRYLAEHSIARYSVYHKLQWI